MRRDARRAQVNDVPDAQKAEYPLPVWWAGLASGKGVAREREEGLESDALFGLGRNLPCWLGRANELREDKYGAGAAGGNESCRGQEHRRDSEDPATNRLRMHHTLRIPEVVAIIFDYCSPSLLFRPSNAYPHRQATTDLAALARTCRAFKEPALDVLWKDLHDLSPLVRCIPTAFRQSQARYNQFQYSFIRPLTQDEWDVFRSYACRIRSVWSLNRLDWESVAAFLIPSTTDPLFPNIRMLRCVDACADQAMSLLCLPLPSLVHINLKFLNESVAQIALESFSKHSPNITQLCVNIFLHRDLTRLLRIILGCTCSWKNLRSVALPSVALDVDALEHLSRLPTLITLEFILDIMLPASDSSLAFPNLQVLKLRSDFLDLISRLLSQTRLPALRDFYASLERCPSRQELLSFFAAFPERDTCFTIEVFWLKEEEEDDTIGPEILLLDLEVLQPCMAFSHIRRLKLDIRCDVALTSSQLLMLASEWPELEELAINESWGWNTAGGLTPCGLVQLLEACRSLRRLALCFDTRGYTKVSTLTSRALENLKFELAEVYVLDSALAARSVPAVTAFFRKLVTSSKAHLGLWNWADKCCRYLPDTYRYERRWDCVFANSTDSEGTDFEADRSEAGGSGVGDSEAEESE